MKKPSLLVLLVLFSILQACTQGVESPEELARILTDALVARDVLPTKPYLATVDDIAYLGAQAGRSGDEIESKMADLRSDPDRLERNWDESWLRVTHELNKSRSEALPSTPIIKMRNAGQSAFIRIAFRVDNGIVTVETVGLRNGKWRFLPPMGFESETIGRP